MFNEHMAESKKDNSRYLMWAVVALAVLALALASLYFWQVAPKRYSAVLLANGDIYFGQLSHFPRMTLSDPYTLQVVADPANPEQSSLQIIPLSVLAWAPEKVVLNPDQVVSTSKIGKDSQVMRFIESRSAAPVGPAGTTQPPPADSTEGESPAEANLEE